MLSLSVKNIEDFAAKLGIDIDTSNVTSDSSGDYLMALDPDLDFKEVRKKILNNVVIKKKIVNQGILFVELYDTLWVDGYRVHVAILVECGIGRVGTKIKIVVKYVEAEVNGKMKQFLSFEALRAYSELIQN